MSPAWLAARSELRQRWKSLALIVVLVGVVAAVVLSTLAGARRTHSSLRRFNEASRSSDIQLFLDSLEPRQMAEFRRSPDVEAVGVGIGYFVLFPSDPNLNAVGPVDGSVGRDVDRARLIAGRRPDPSSAVEVDVDESIATRAHLKVGSRLDAQSFTEAQAASLGAGATDPGQPGGPPLHFDVVGIVRRPADLGSGAGFLVTTPGFNHRYQSEIGSFGYGVLVRTVHGGADLKTVAASTRRIFGSSAQFGVSDLTSQNFGAQSAINVLTDALLLFAAVSAAAGATALVIVLFREIALGSGDQQTLRTLGMTRSARTAVMVPAIAIVGVGGACLGIVGAIAASPLFPIGIARLAEPDPGVHLDPLVLAVGGLAVVAFVGMVGAVAAVWAGRVTTRTTRRVSRSTVSAWFGRRTTRPAFATGVRMALQRGRDRRAVPLWTSYVGAALGVLGVTAVLVFSTNLAHLAASPSRYGWPWQFKVSDIVSNETSCSRDDFGLLAQPGIEAATAVCYGIANVTLDGRATNGWGFVPLRGDIGPDIISGAPPTAGNEVALGASTLQALHRRIGDEITAKGPNGGGRYRITGEAVFSGLGQAQPLDDGAAFTAKGYAPLFDQNNFYRYIVGQRAPGFTEADLQRRVSKISQLDDLATATVPPEIARLTALDWVPFGLALLLGGLGLVAILYTLTTSTRRRRHDLAILRALGFESGDVRSTIAWHATTLAVIGLVIGIPVGLVVGRDAWRLVAHSLGVLPETQFPVLAVILVAPVAIIIANVSALFPARSAAVIPPAAALRSE